MAGFDDWGEGTSGAEHNDARLDHGRFTPLNPKTVTPEEHEQHVSNIEGQIRGASALERRAGARFYSRAHRDATRVGLGMAPGKQPYDNPVQRPGHTPLRKATPDQQARFHDPVQRDEAAKRGAGAIAALSPSSPAGMNWENNPTAAHEAWGLTTQHVAGLRHAVGMDRVAGQARGAVRSAKNSGIGLPEAKRAADRAETESKAASTTARADALGGVSSLQHAGNGAIIRAHEILSGEREPEDVLPMDAKGHPHGTGILTPSGFVPVEDLRPGDLVIGSAGSPVKLLGNYRRGVLPVYRVMFSDGSSVRVDGEHLWHARPHNGKYRTIETRELISVLHKRWEIPLVSSPVEVDAANNLPVDPYILGVLLGDGHIRDHGISFCTGDDRTPEEVLRRLPEGYILTPDGTSFSITQGPAGRTGRGHRSNSLVNAMRELDLAGKRSYEKFVPDVYLYANPERRLDLLRGLMDTDGGLSRGHTSFSSSSEALCDNVRFLVESFGGTARKSVQHKPKYSYKGKVHEGRTSYRLSINITVNPFLTREGWQPYPRKHPKRVIARIDREGSAEVTCLRVDALDHLYVTEHCIVTHNTGHFYRAIRNPRDPSAAVIDGRSHDIALGTHMPWDTNRALGAKGRYQYFVDSHAEAADRTGVTPSQGQAISWIHDKNTMMAKSTPALRALGRGNSRETGEQK